MSEYIAVFKSLSDMTRIRIIRLLLKAKRELCICEIMDSLHLPQYNISKHMKELKYARIVKERREGRFVFYALNSAQKRFSDLAIKAVGKISDKCFCADNKNLRLRLSFRKNGKCIVGITKKICKC